VKFRDFVDLIVCKLIDLEIEIEEKCSLLDWNYGRSSLCVFVVMWIRMIEMILIELKRFVLKY